LDQFNHQGDANQMDIGTTSATAGDSLKTLPKNKDSILSTSVLGILLDTQN